MLDNKFSYRWEWQFKSDPKRLWPWVSDTNRFDFDAGFPVLHKVPGKSSEWVIAKVRTKNFGMPIEWEEYPFEWIYPRRFALIRKYTRGPFLEMQIRAELMPQETGTKLIYDFSGLIRNRFFSSLVKFVINRQVRKVFENTFRNFDRLAVEEKNFELGKKKVYLETGASERMREIQERLNRKGWDDQKVSRLTDVIAQADDLTVVRMRPYLFADEWKWSRKEILELFLEATREGLLEFQWHLLCPLCRGGEKSTARLSELPSEMHCGVCRIDYNVNLERFVEIAFRPNPSIRKTEHKDFCIGNPQRTPHVVYQKVLKPGETAWENLSLESGRYRLRCLRSEGAWYLRVGIEGVSHAEIKMNASLEEEIRLLNGAQMSFVNDSPDQQLLILEKMDWSEQATTASDVIALQKFRDLFSGEVLRKGQEISVGSLAIVFTDLKSSTKLYREIGDAPAFGLVMNHFDILKSSIAKHGGALIKTIGDAVMAVFSRPIDAIEAMLEAGKMLENPPTGVRPLKLKSGIHYGHCIAVTLNDKLDYFGSTINLAARLEQFSSGGDVILSESVLRDPEVKAFTDSNKALYELHPLETSLKGFDAEQFKLWRLALPEHSSKLNMSK